MGTTSRDTAHGSACCSRPSHPPSPSAHSSSSAGQLPGRSHACSRGSWTLRPVRSKDRRRGRAAPQLAGRPFNRRWKPSPQAYPALGASYCPTASTLCMRSSCSWGSGPGCTAGRGPARLSVTSTRSLQRGQRGGGGARYFSFQPFNIAARCHSGATACSRRAVRQPAREAWPGGSPPLTQSSEGTRRARPTAVGSPRAAPCPRPTFPTTARGGAGLGRTSQATLVL